MRKARGPFFFLRLFLIFLKTKQHFFQNEREEQGWEAAAEEVFRGGAEEEGGRGVWRGCSGATAVRERALPLLSRSVTGVVVAVLVAAESLLLFARGRFPILSKK